MDSIVFLGAAAGPLLAIAAALFLLDFFLLFRASPAESRSYTLAFVGSVAACLFVVASYLILTAAFLTDAFSFREVYASSSSTLAVLYKLGGPWIGSSGSLLFVTLVLALFNGICRVRGFEKETRTRRTTYQILDLYLAFLLVVTMLQSPFRQMAVTPPEGLGLTPLLQTSWVLAHPPIIFLGYVAVLVAFALLLAGLAAGTGGSPAVRRSIRLSLIAAWLLLTIGISLGGLWSYRVLGWGGYWAWDPVETASLLPWLALTAYFHFAGPGRQAIRDVLLALAFFMVVFATVITRGGFSESVHAYGGESPVGLLFLGFAIAGLLAFLWLRRRHEPVKEPSRFWIDTSSLLSISRSVAAWSLVALLGVCFLGSAAPIAGSLVAGGPFTVDPNFFTLITYPLTLAFVAALIGCNTEMRPKSFATLIAAALGIGAVLALIALPTPYALANLGLPLLIASGGVVVYRWIHEIRGGSVSLRLWGRALLHLSIVVILLGVFISTAGQNESLPVPATANSSLDALGLNLTIHDLVLSPGTGQVWVASQSVVAPEHSGLRTEVEIRDGGTIRSGTLWMYEYLNYGVVSEPLIVSTPTRDLYLSMHQTNSSYAALVQALVGNTTPPRDVTIAVKIVPLIWLVWLGVLMMVIGMGIVFFDELLRSRPERGPRPPPPQTGAESGKARNRREPTAPPTLKRKGQ